jgi:UDP-glucuronate 4-epimerase
MVRQIPIREVPLPKVYGQAFAFGGILKIIVTGCAGFIGAALTRRLLDAGSDVVGIDNLNDYYDPSLKRARLAPFRDHPRFTFFQDDIANGEAMARIFEVSAAQTVMHLAAQAGVRYSIENPMAYIEANLKGFGNVLEGCRHHGVKHLIYASTSSVYGLNATMPLSPHHSADHPVSFYAATKKANELMAHSYSHLYRLPTTGVRFFTVYGPWGRPDMALFLFTKNILDGKPIQVFNYGKHKRDFTFVDDLVSGLERIVLGAPATPNPGWNALAPDPATSSAPYRIFNIGNQRGVELLTYIEAIEKAVGLPAVKVMVGPQAGDVEATLADVSDLVEHYDYQPSTPVEVGVERFVAWYRKYYRV